MISPYFLKNKKGKSQAQSLKTFYPLKQDSLFPLIPINKFSKPQRLEAKACIDFLLRSSQFKNNHNSNKKSDYGDTLETIIEKYHIPENYLKKIIRARQMENLIDGFKTKNQLLKYCHLLINSSNRIQLYLLSYPLPKLFESIDKLSTSAFLIDWFESYIQNKKTFLKLNFIPQEDCERFHIDSSLMYENQSDRKMKRLFSYELDFYENLLAESQSLKIQIPGKVGKLYQITYLKAKAKLNKIRAAIIQNNFNAINLNLNERIRIYYRAIKT